MKKFLALIGALALAATGAASAANLTILGPSPSNVLTSGDPDPNCTGGQGGTDTAFLTGSCSVISTNLELLYKFDIGGGESGKFLNLFSTTGLTAPGTMTLTDTYNSPNTLGGYSSFWLVVKDGNANPGRYGYNITSNWAGNGFIQLNSFWPSNGEISHVALFGNSSTNCAPNCFNETPEPSSLALGGLALLAAGLVRRRRALR